MSGPRLRQLELMRAGACAAVYRGLWVGERGSERTVAIKRLLPELAGDARRVDLFVQEGRLATRLSHSNLVQGLELGRDEQGYYLVCEWIDGDSIEALVERRGPMPWEAAVTVALAVSEALTYLHHARGPNGEASPVVHRDVTPANVMLSRAGEVKLTDLGIAACVADVQGTLVRAGSTRFAAPEQLAHGATDPRVDVYGLCATLQAMTAALPAEVAAVVERGLATSPDARWPTSEALHEALEAAARAAGGIVGRSSLRAWLAVAPTGAPAHEARDLDAAVRSILGPSVSAAPAVSAPSPEVATRARRTRVPGLALAGIVVLAVGAVVFWYARPRTDLALPHGGAASGSGRAEPEGARPGPAAAPATGPATESATRTAPPAGPELVAAVGTRTDPAAPARARHAGTPGAARSEPPAASASRRAEAGRLRVNSVPWSHVELDGKSVGVTPVRELAVTPGRHRLRFVQAEQGLEHVAEIEILARRAHVVVADLRQRTVSERHEELSPDER